MIAFIKYIVVQLLFAFITVATAPLFFIYSICSHVWRSYHVAVASGLLTNFAGWLTWFALGVLVVPLCAVKNTCIFLWCGPNIFEEAVDAALRPLE